MINQLTDDQIDRVLTAQSIGRIGCHVDGKTYVVPVAYAFDGKHIYAHSRPGLKVTMMRKNPLVCFQVDIIADMASWQCVILDGEYEELKTNALQLKAYKLLKDRLSPLVTSDAAKPVQSPPPGEKRLRPIFFRILILGKSGRYEKR